MATTQKTLDGDEYSKKNQYVTEHGSSINTRERDDGTVEEQCPSCGNWYKRINSHWSQSSCDYPPISQRQYEIVVGLMMGDGTLGKRTENKMCRVQTKMTNKTFLQWLKQGLDWLSSNFCTKYTSIEKAKHDSESDFISDAKAENRFDQYCLQTRSHPIFDSFNQWWATGELVFPQVNLTPTVLRMWYVSDGTLNFQSNSRIKITSVNEKDRPENIIKSFGDIGFDVTQSRKEFCLLTQDTEQFFDYIGHDPVPGFEYKWAWQDEDRYHRLKDAHDHVHCTQTLE